MISKMRMYTVLAHPRASFVQGHIPRWDAHQSFTQTEENRYGEGDHGTVQRGLLGDTHGFTIP